MRERFRTNVDAVMPHIISEVAFSIPVNDDVMTKCHLAELIFNPAREPRAAGNASNGPPCYIYGVSGVLVGSCLKLNFRHFDPVGLSGVLSVINTLAL
jgi:hypothetical protein